MSNSPIRAALTRSDRSNYPRLAPASATEPGGRSRHRFIPLFLFNSSLP